MSWRKSIEVEGFRHGKLPIPVASRIRDFVATGGIPGFDLQTGQYPPDPAAQTANAFVLLRKILSAAGVTPDDVIRVTVFVKDPAVREFVNKEWVEMFPHPHSRPARHMLNYELAAPLLLQIDALAVAAPQVTGDSQASA